MQNNQTPSPRLPFPRDGFRCWPYAPFNEETANYLTGGNIQPTRPADSTTEFHATTSPFGYQGAEFPRTFAVDAISNYYNGFAFPHPNLGSINQDFGGERPRPQHGGNFCQNDFNGITRPAGSCQSSSRQGTRASIWSDPRWQRRLGPIEKSTVDAAELQGTQRKAESAPHDQEGRRERRGQRRRPLDRAERAPRRRKRGPASRKKTTTNSQAQDPKSKQEESIPTGANAEPLGASAPRSRVGGDAVGAEPELAAGGKRVSTNDGTTGRSDPFLGTSGDSDDGLSGFDDSLLDFDLGD